MLSREDILRSQDLVREVVSCPEWGGEVYVRVMTGEERDRYEHHMLSLQDLYKDDKVNLQTLRIALLSLCLCDEQGGRLFQFQEMQLLNEKSWVVLDRLYEVASRINKTTVKEIEELVGNSVPTPTDASGSTLP